MQKKKGPWTVTGTKVVYKNPWMTVREDKVITPAGKRGLFGTVEWLPGCSVIALDEKRNIYLTKEYHYAMSKVTIEAVSGGIDRKETKLAAAKRELKEEAGITAKKWTHLGLIHPFTSQVGVPNYLYLAEGLSFGETDLDETEQITIVKMPLKKALDLIESGKITHGATVATLLKIARRLRI